MEKEPKELHLTLTHNSFGEEGYFLSQEEMRQLLIDFRSESNLTVENLAKLMDVDPDIIRDYEAGQYNLTLEAYRLLFYIYSFLEDDFKVHN